MGVDHFRPNFYEGDGLVGVLVVVLVGVLEDVLVGVLVAGLVFGICLSTISAGSGRIGVEPKLLVWRLYSEVLSGTLGVVVVFLWRLSPGFVVVVLLNRKGSPSSFMSSTTMGSVLGTCSLSI